MRNKSEEIIKEIEEEKKIKLESDITLCTDDLPDYELHESMYNAIRRGYQAVGIINRYFAGLGLAPLEHTEEIEKACDKYFKQYWPLISARSHMYKYIEHARERGHCNKAILSMLANRYRKASRRLTKLENIAAEASDKEELIVEMICQELHLIEPYGKFKEAMEAMLEEYLADQKKETSRD